MGIVRARCGGRRTSSKTGGEHTPAGEHKRSWVFFVPQKGDENTGLVQLCHVSSMIILVGDRV